MATEKQTQYKNMYHRIEAIKEQLYAAQLQIYEVSTELHSPDYMEDKYFVMRAEEVNARAKCVSLRKELNKLLDVAQNHKSNAEIRRKKRKAVEASQKTVKDNSGPEVNVTIKEENESVTQEHVAFKKELQDLQASVINKAALEKNCEALKNVQKR